MKYTVSFLFILAALSSFSQAIIEWSPNYTLTLGDFQSLETEVNDELRSNSISTGTNMDFGFHMSTYEFMFTKNFNSKVKTTFYKKAAVIIATDTTTALQMVNFGQYYFDLTELYSRKFRRELHEQKGAFSNVNFFQPIFNQLQEELQAENARVSKLTELGRKEELLNLEHQQVLDQIDLLSDYCYDCKPPKKKKK